ncbi:MAG: hypothetical protein ACRETD_11800, partial [Steroidobacteraceae bacterium]
MPAGKGAADAAAPETDAGAAATEAGGLDDPPAADAAPPPLAGALGAPPEPGLLAAVAPLPPVAAGARELGLPAPAEAATPSIP